ncbi:hypothetical protein AAY473_004697 [Plecturocebus cupreus]
MRHTSVALLAWSSSEEGGNRVTEGRPWAGLAEHGAVSVRKGLHVNGDREEAHLHITSGCPGGSHVSRRGSFGGCNYGRSEKPVYATGKVELVPMENGGPWEGPGRLAQALVGCPRDLSTNWDTGDTCGTRGTQLACGVSDLGPEGQGPVGACFRDGCGGRGQDPGRQKQGGALRSWGDQGPTDWEGSFGLRKDSLREGGCPGVRPDDPRRELVLLEAMRNQGEVAPGLGGGPVHTNPAHMGTRAVLGPAAQGSVLEYSLGLSRCRWNYP